MVRAVRPELHVALGFVAGSAEKVPRVCLPVDVDGRPGRLILAAHVTMLFGDRMRREIAAKRLWLASKEFADVAVA